MDLGTLGELSAIPWIGSVKARSLVFQTRPTLTLWENSSVAARLLQSIISFRLLGPLTPAGDTTQHAFLWQNGAMTDLGTLPGDSFSFAFNLNNKGQVVGISCGADECRGWRWQDGSMTDINTLIPTDSNLFVVEPHDVNSRGRIVGIALQIDTGEAHAFLATPTSPGIPALCLI